MAMRGIGSARVAVSGWIALAIVCGCDADAPPSSAADPLQTSESDTVVSTTAPAPMTVSKVLLFGSDGMRQDRMLSYAASGRMPTYRSLLGSGVRTTDGFVGGFPSNTAAGSLSLATGAFPGEHGVLAGTFHRTGDSSFNNRTSSVSAAILQADSLAAAAERAGKKVAQLDWFGGSAAGISGPTVEYGNFFSTRGVLAYPFDATEQAGANGFGLSYQIATFAPASGFTNSPPSDSAAPPMATTLTVATTFAAQNPQRVFDVYVYDSVVDGTAAYDSVLLVRAGANKDLFKATALPDGVFVDWKLTGADGLIGVRAGQTASFYVKLMTLAPDLSQFKVYFTSVARVQAKCSTAECNALPAGGAGQDRLEKYLADNLPGFVVADAAPLAAGIIDEDTYVQQAVTLESAYGNAVTSYVLGTLQPDTDLALVGHAAVEAVSRTFLGLVSPTDSDGNPNPVFDAGRVAAREEYLAKAYAAADAKLAVARGLLGSNPATFAVSDHGMTPAWYAVNAAKVLADAGLQSPEQSANCRAAATTNKAKACWDGAAAHIYVNLIGRDPNGEVSSAEYASVRDQIVAAFQNLTDPANPGKAVVSAVYTKEQLRNVEGADILHPSRSGDVVVVLRPPYQFDEATRGKLVDEPFGLFGVSAQRGFLSAFGQGGSFVAAGPTIRHQDPIAPVRPIDVAPTIAFALGIPGPHNARGRILYPVFTSPGRFKEVSILDVADYHGQLVPLSEPADNVATNASYAIGGAAFLKPWFDVYRAEAWNGSLTVSGGDSVGATPLISRAFFDAPTIEAMNLMGFSADALGHHEFDLGQAYLRQTLIPLAQFSYLSANVVDARGNTPREWAASKVYSFDSFKLGIVGFSNDDLASLVPDGALDPFQVNPPTKAINDEAARLKAKGVKAIVALGHVGATGGTLVNPTGSLVELGDNVTGVAAVIGDRTNFQAISRRSNGVLVTENLSKGIRFSRLRLTVDSNTKDVVYKTADYHRPWDIGITPNATIQQKIDDWNSQLGPMLSTVIGNSTRLIPRADACGNASGLTCESLVGDLVADAMRKTYATDFAITNSGGLRNALTCPTMDNPSDFCPAYVAPPYPISRGQVLAVLPFGDAVVTLRVNGAELKTMLENGVSIMPAAGNRFAQVSGLCFTYDIALPVGSRVLGAVHQASDGSCTGPAIDLTAASEYSLAESDYMADGGDGYPNFLARVGDRGPMDQVVADYVYASTPVAPAIQGRIACTTSGGIACPVVTP